MIRAARRGLLAVAAAALLIPLAAVGPAAAGQVFFAEMFPENEVPGPGEADAFAFAELVITPGEGPSDGTLCVSLVFISMTTATAAHVHQGAADEAGPIVVTLPTPDEDGLAEDCVDGLATDLLADIASNPAGYYVNVHTADHPAGAVRGQIETITTIPVIVTMLACPETVTSPADVDGHYRPCAPVALPGDVAAPADGYTYDPEPIQANIEIGISGFLTSLLIEDAEPIGGSECDPETLTCQGSQGYRWTDVVPSFLDVTQYEGPPGYHLEFATVTFDGGETFEGSLDPAHLGVHFDASEARGVSVVLFNLAGEGPPRPTLPATSSASVAPGSSTDAVGGSVVPVGAFLAAAAAAAILSIRIRRHGFARSR